MNTIQDVLDLLRTGLSPSERKLDMTANNWYERKIAKACEMLQEMLDKQQEISLLLRSQLDQDKWNRLMRERSIYGIPEPPEAE
jgi:hypothetical protein